MRHIEDFVECNKLNKSLIELYDSRDYLDSNGFEDEEVKEYIESIKQYPKLSIRDTYVLIDRYKRGDQESFKKLVNCNLYLVIPLVRYYENCGLETMDLIQEGNIGLMEAIMSYEPERGYQYSYFYFIKITEAIQDAVYNKSRIIKIPERAFDYFDSVYRYMLCKNVDFEIACRELNIDYRICKKYIDLYVYLSDIISIDEYIDNEICIYETKDFIKSAECYGLRERLLFEMKPIIYERDYNILCHRYGFDGKELLGTNEIAKKFSITRSRVHQIEQRAMRRLRNHRKFRNFKDYIRY